MSTPSAYQVIEISEQPIALCQLLKIANLVSGGGEAKIVISEGYVLLNNEVEYQKRKKVYEHDIVEFNGEMVQIVLNTNLAKKPAKSSKINSTTVTNKKAPRTEKKKTHSASQETNNSAPAKRKPISF